MGWETLSPILLCLYGTAVRRADHGKANHIVGGARCTEPNDLAMDAKLEHVLYLRRGSMSKLAVILL
jgi:hypothetical protein